MSVWVCMDIPVCIHDYISLCMSVCSCVLCLYIECVYSRLMNERIEGGLTLNCSLLQIIQSFILWGHDFFQVK